MCKPARSGNRILSVTVDPGSMQGPESSHLFEFVAEEARHNVGQNTSKAPDIRQSASWTMVENLRRRVSSGGVSRWSGRSCHSSIGGVQAVAS